MFQKEEGVNSVECYQEVKKSCEKMSRDYNNQVVVWSLGGDNFTTHICGIDW